jgi:hypothetical protein
VCDDNPVISRKPGDLPNGHLQIFKLLFNGAFLAFPNERIAAKSHYQCFVFAFHTSYTIASRFYLTRLRRLKKEIPISSI